MERPIKTKQLLVYGKPSTQKTLILDMLGKVVKIYYASSRKNDFTGAHNYFVGYLMSFPQETKNT